MITANLTQLCFVPHKKKVEKITYNALPAALTGSECVSFHSCRVSPVSKNDRLDMWSRQYLQQQNQIGAQNMNPYVITTH